MDGATLKYQLRQVLAESSTSSWIDDKTSYDYLWQAAIEFVRQTWCLTANQSITTVANQSAYDLNADFLCLYMQNDRCEYFIKYDAGNNSIYWPTYREYAAQIYANNTNSTSIPDTFTIRDKRTAETRLSGNATANSTATYGEANLTDTTLTQFANASVGDTVYNLTGDDVGIIAATSSNNTVITAMFDNSDGNSASWATNDSYYVTPQSRKQLILDPPSSTASHTVTVEYVQRPDPVYSPHRSYRIPYIYTSAIVKYAAWLYKYRDMQPNFGDSLYKLWELELRRAKGSELKQDRFHFRVNFMKRSFRDRSYR